MLVKKYSKKYFHCKLNHKQKLKFSYKTKHHSNIIQATFNTCKKVTHCKVCLNRKH